MSSQEKWAQSLVGRDWEIFWDNSEEEQEEDRASANNQQLSESNTTSQGKMIALSDKEAVSQPPAVGAGSVPGPMSGSPMPMSSGWPQHLPGLWPGVGPPQIALNPLFYTPNPASMAVMNKMLQNAAPTPAVPGEASSATEPAPTEPKDEKAAEENMEDAEDEEEEVISDWYDARILEYKITEGDKVSFKIIFVGEDHTYSMELSPSNIRPSARAWVKRTKKLLSTREAEGWEAALPADTSTLKDQAYLMELKEKLLGSASSEASPPDALHYSGSVAHPGLLDFNEMQLLRYHVKSQIYLRSKLAPIVDLGEKDDDVPTEQYANYLVSCLQKVEACCRWYNNCSKLHKQVYEENANISSDLDVDFVRKSCIEDGRDEIVSTFTMDITPSGSKRSHLSSQPSGARRTKRRKIRRDPSHHVGAGDNLTDNNDYFSDVDERSFFSHKAVERFSKRIGQEASRWFDEILLDMLRSTSYYIQEPLVSWIRKAECFLGDRRETEDDQSSAVTSVEEKEYEEGKGKDADELDDDISMDEVDVLYSFEDIKRLLDRIPMQKVLQRFNLSKWTQKLDAKLCRIKEAEEQAWTLLSKLPLEPELSSSGTDVTLMELLELKRELFTPGSFLVNIHPLATSKSSKMTKDVIEDACLVREWVVDLSQAECYRERVVFVQDIVTRASDLPHIPPLPGEATGEGSLASQLAHVMSRIQNVSSKLYSNVHIVTQYERHLTDSSDASTDSQGLRKLKGVKKALDSLAMLPVLSLVEEKLSVRKDMLLWVEHFKSAVPGSRSIPFPVLEGHYGTLTQILSGMSTSRARLTDGLRRNETMEKEVRQFVREDVNNLTDNIGPEVEKLYLRSAAWKERAEAIIFALQFYGNPYAGKSIKTSRPPVMVDCKRMADLLEEYDTLNVTITDEYNVIQDAYNDTISWSERVASILEGRQNLLSCLKQCREERPKGVIVDPARHILDHIIDLLEWHNSVKSAVKKLQLDGTDEPDHELHRSLFLLMEEGSEVIEMYSQERNGDFGFVITGQNVRDLLGRAGLSQNASKVFAVSKVTATPVGSAVCQTLSSLEFDASNGHPLFYLLYVAWTLTVMNFVANASQASTNPTRPTLTEAIALSLREPTGADVFSAHSLLSSSLQGAVASLKSLIKEGEDLEAEARKIIAPEKDTFRGSINKESAVRQYLAALKNLQSRMKSTKQGGPGLIINSTFEKPVDQLVRDISWLVKTLAYPVIHDNGSDVEPEKRVPWEILVGLFERTPSTRDGIVADIPKLVLRVRELHEAANQWQEEVSSLLALSIRGAKRRQAGSAVEGDSDGQDAQALLTNVKLTELAKDPILKLVLIPREAAVHEVLQKTREFERLMNDLLGKDYEESDVDKAAYPEEMSLVGVDGRFHFYRLTGSPLFSVLKDSIDVIGQLAEDIPADTLGKQAFEWIRLCVRWLDAVNACITNDSPFGGTDKLVIKINDATSLLKAGNDLLLEISEEVRKTLSNHKIILSTNKQTERLTVTVAKGGAHHSCGGTGIKWCPLVLEWLKNDIEMHNRWKVRAGEIMQKCIAISGVDASQISATQEVVNKIYQCAENVRLLLEQGRELLVVAPDKEFADKIIFVGQKLEMIVDAKIKSSEGKANLNAAMISRYDDAESLIDQRESYLDALLTRRRIQMSRKTKKSAEEARPKLENVKDLRERARAKLEKVMRKGMKMMGLRVEGAPDFALHCTLKAWEIESAAFSAFPEPGDSRDVSSQWAQTMVAVNANLDPLKNAALCARVLGNEVTAEDLVFMTPDEMANSSLREQRAKQEAVKVKSIIIAGKGKSPPDPKGKKVKSLKNLIGGGSTTKQSPVSPKAKHTRPQVQQQALLQIPVLTQQTLTSFPPDSIERSPLNAGKGTLDPLAIASALQAAQKAQKSLAPPPPPPPQLAPPAAAAMPPPPGRNDDRDAVTSSDGKDRFTFNIHDKGVSASFQANILMEDDLAPNIDRVLPSTLKNKGRLKPDEFIDFASRKTRSNKYVIVPFRISVCGGSDRYKRFYKHFEDVRRLAFFKFDDHTNMCLLTPKYHHVARELNLTLSNKTSTYGILIKQPEYY
jgi:hypothetical protein